MMADGLTSLSSGLAADVHAVGFTRRQLEERAIHRRAVEAVIWGMPAVNFDLMLHAFITNGGAANQVPYWSRLLDGTNQSLTPNPDTIYLNPFYDTKLAGPMVLEIPPAEGGSITGSIDDCWQNALEDVGPAGVDKGAGGKYLILPPGHDGAMPDGYIAIQSDTWQGYALLRSNVKSGSEADVAAAVAYGRQVRFYPLSQAADPPETHFVDLAGKLYDATIPYGVRFFRSLARMVGYEPWLPRDRAMIDPLRTLGIAKGKTFDPDAATQKILISAALEAQVWLDAHYEEVFDPPFYPGGHWALPALPEVAEGMPSLFAAPDAYPTDGRGITYSMAYFSAKHIGVGQYYLMTIRDRDGHPFDGGATYRLRVPPDAPVRLYWSATAYDRNTHALIRDVPRASRASNSPEIVTEPDGSVALWFGPRAPAGREGNWVPTRAEHGFEVLFRIYGPEKAFFDKSWVLPDVEKIG
jgi:hypothetical protein